GSAPTDAAYDCRPYTGGSAESCTVQGPGVIYIGVKGYAAATVSIRIRFMGTTVTPPPPPPATTQHLNVSGTVAQGEMKMFQLQVPAGVKVVVRTTAATDVDLYVKMGSAPTESS